MKISKISPITLLLITRDIPVDPDKYLTWLKSNSKGEDIKHIFPELSEDDQEYLYSGITREEWVQEFGPNHALPKR